MTDTRTPQRERVDTLEFVDLIFQVLATQISSNYEKHIRAKLLPRLDEHTKLPIRELRTLMCVAHFADPIKGSTIVKVLGFDPATVTRSTRWLIQKDLLKSQPNHLDARSILYALTDSGIEFTTLYRDMVKQMTLDLNDADASAPTQEELAQAVATFIKVRDRSALAMKLGK